MLARGLLLAALVTATSSYKIRRSECWVEEGEGEASTTMVCTCGGIGDPYSIIMNKGPKPELGVPWYGTRYGHNLAEQVKQHMLDLNVTTVTELHYTNCTGQHSALRIKIDFEDFAMDSYFKRNLTALQRITFSNLTSVNLYLNSALDWGNLTISFQNIHQQTDFGYGREGSVVVHGEVDHCTDPCMLADSDSCNNCDPASTLTLEFDSLETVMLDGLVLAPGARRGQHGASLLRLSNVSQLLVSGGRYTGLQTQLGVGRCEAWGEAANCSEVLGLGGVELVEEGVPGLVIAALAVVFVFIAVVGVVVGMNGIKNSEDY